MKRFFQVGLAAAGVVALLAAAAIVVIQSNWFRERVRQRVIAEMEKATGGGRVEIARFEFEPRRLEARLEGIVIHGTEPAGERPLFQAANIDVSFKIVSFLKQRVDLIRIRCKSPEFSFQVNADGSSNLPSPKKRSVPGVLLTQELLNFNVNSLQLEGGAVWWNDRRYALEIAASQVQGRMTLHRSGSYEGSLRTGRTVVGSALALPPIDELALAFRLAQDHADVTSASLRTAGSEWQASGSVDHLEQPRVEMRYEGRAEAGEAAKAMHLPELKAGRVTTRGQGRYDSGRGEWSAEGKLGGEALALASPEVHLNGVSLSCQYHLDAKRLTADDLRLRLLGGEWRGRAEADYPLLDHPGKASAEGTIEGIRLEALTGALATRTMPLNRLGWAAVIRGTLRGSASLPPAAKNISFESNLELTPPGQPDGKRPVTGALALAYDGRTSDLRVNALQLSTDASSLSADGEAAGRTINGMRFHLETSRPDEIIQAAESLGASVSLPVQVSGKATADGRVSGSFDRPVVASNVEISRFSFGGREWDSFKGRLEASPSRLQTLSGRLLKGAAGIDLTLSAGLSGGKIAPDSPLEIEASLHNISAQDAAALAGHPVPVTGLMNGSVHLRGTQNEPQGTGQLEIVQGKAWDEPFDRVRAAFLFSASEARVTDAQWTRGRGMLRGTGSFALGPRTFRFDVQGEQLALSEQPWLAATGRKIAGAAALEVKGAGQLAQGDSHLETLTIEGSAELRKVTVDGIALGDASLVGHTEGDRLQVQIKSDFLQSATTGAGEVTLRDNFPARGWIEFRQLNVGPAMRLEGVPVWPERATADGRVEASGELRKANGWQAESTLSRLELGWPAASGRPGAVLHNASPVTLRLAKNMVAVKSFHLAGEGSDLQSTGTIDLRSDGAVRLDIKGSLNLAALNSFESKLEASGTSVISATVTGRREQPQLEGRLDIQRAALRVPDSPLALSNANGSVLFTRQRAILERLTAQAGGGELICTGDADFGSRPATYRLQTEAKQIRLRYREGVSAVMDGTLNFVGAGQQSSLRGDVRLTRAAIAARWDLGTIVAELKRPPRTPGPSDWLQGAQLDVHVVSAPNFLFETSLARNLAADADLRLRGTVLDPVLLGRINITGGEVQFQGTRYVFQRGDITFANPVRVDPILNLDLESRVSSYEVTLTLSGPLERLNVSYRSDPPLAFNDLVNLLALGRAPAVDPVLAAQQTSQARTLSDVSASTLIGQALSQQSGGALQRFFGVGRVKIDPQMSGPEINPSPHITVQQNIGNQITFTYVSSLGTAQQQLVQIEWAVNRQWSIVAVRDENGLYGVNFLYRRRYR